MICEICGEKEAVVHIQQIVGEDVFELHLCESCAQEKGISTKEDKIEFSISEILTGLLKTEELTGKDLKSLQCSQCGKKYGEFKKEGKLGCVECYNTFSTEIRSIVKSMCGNVRHKGKYPAKLKMYKTLLIDKERVKQKLKEAVTKENYEEAACLRDRILEIERASGDKNV